MKLNDMFINKAITKETLVDVSAAMVHSIPDLATMSTVWKEALADAQHIPGSIKLVNSRILSYIRVSKTARDLPSTTLLLLPNMATNLSQLSEYVIASFPEEYVDKVATVKQKVTMAYLSLFYHVSIYFPDLVTTQLQILASLKTDGELFAPSQRKAKELDDGLTTFAIALDVLGMEPKLFSDIYTSGYPEVESKSGIDALLSANGIDNPLARVKDGFRGNPFFSIGQWMNTTVVDYVKYMEDRKRVSKLYLEQLKASRDNSGSPANDKEIQLLESDISDLEYRIHKASK